MGKAAQRQTRGNGEGHGGEWVPGDSRHSTEEKKGKDLAQLAFCVLDISPLLVNNTRSYPLKPISSCREAWKLTS